LERAPYLTDHKSTRAIALKRDPTYASGCLPEGAGEQVWSNLESRRDVPDVLNRGNDQTVSGKV